VLRRGALAVVVMLVVLPATATADKQVESRTGNTFSPRDVTMDQGEKLFFRHADLTSTKHNVQSDAVGPDGQPLFKSADITTGTTIVEGAQYLKTGTYTFVCTFHAPGMAGTLHITANGTPQQRPGGGSAADTTAPTISVRLRTAHQSSIRRSRKLTVSVSASEAATISLKATALVHGKAITIARGKAKLPAEGSTRRALSLTSAGRKALNGKRAVTVKVTARAVDAAGNVGKASRSKRYSP
jgi:plastocyanin